MKYRLTAETKMWFDHELHQIEATEDFYDVKAGDLGGWIESEKNLSQEGNAWVYGDAKVYGGAQVCDNAKVYGNAEVCDNAKVYGNATVFGNAWVHGNAKVYGGAKVYGNAEVCGNAWVHGNAKVYGNAWVYGDAKVYGGAQVCDNAKVYGNAEVCDNAKVYGDAWVCDNAKVYGDAWVCDNAKVYGNAEVCGNAKVTFWYHEDFQLGSTDHTVFKNSWSSYRDFFYNAQTRLWSVGCFLGTSEELCRKAYADGVKNGNGYSKYIKFAEMFLDGDHVDVEKIRKEVLENETNKDA